MVDFNAYGGNYGGYGRYGGYYGNYGNYDFLLKSMSDQNRNSLAGSILEKKENESTTASTVLKTTAALGALVGLGVAIKKGKLNNVLGKIKATSLGLLNKITKKAPEAAAAAVK